MARDRANINTNIWTDTHWRSLTRDQQWMYELLLTHTELSYAGVCDWRPGRLAQFAAGTTKADIERLGHDLQAERFILIDEDTEEVLIRSFLRHDGLLKQPKLTISMVNAYGAIASNAIREVVIYELKRLHREEPNLKAFESLKVQAILKNPASPIEEFTQAANQAVTHADKQAFTLNGGQALPLPTTTATTTTTSSNEDKETLSSGIADAMPRPEIDSLLDLLDEQIIRNGGKKPSRTKRNSDAARLLLDRDGYTAEQVAWIIRWATADEFWRANILSMSKLREKFGQLMAKAGVGGRPAGVGFHGDIDVDAVLGRDVWSPGTPPPGLDVAGEIAWKKEQRAAHNAERLEEARRKLGVAA